MCVGLSFGPAPALAPALALGLDNLDKTHFLPPSLFAGR